MADELPPIRRIVCGIDQRGKSVIVEDGAPSAIRPSVRPGFHSRNIWATFGSPARLDDPDRSREITGLMPPAGGTVLKYIDVPPEPADRVVRDRQAQAAEAKRGPVSEAGLRRKPDHRLHPGMHETDSVDYAIVLSGEIYAVMEEGETLMKAGDVLIQNATMHAWANRSDKPCRVLFVLVDGRKEPSDG